jgi:hypothetical protein
MRVIICCPQEDSKVVKERWRSSEAFESLTHSLDKFVPGEDFQALAAELRGNYSLPKGLTKIPVDIWSHYTPLYVFRYSVFEPTFGKSEYSGSLMPARERKRLGARLKRLCIKMREPIVINSRGSNVLGYEVSSKRKAIDGDFIIRMAENFSLMEYNPQKAARIRRDPHTTQDVFHRKGIFRVGELYRIKYLLENEICSLPQFRHLLQYARFYGPCKPVYDDLCYRICLLVGAVQWVRRGPTWRNKHFRGLLPQAGVVLQNVKRLNKTCTHWETKFLKFMRRELRVAQKTGFRV